MISLTRDISHVTLSCTLRRVFVNISFCLVVSMCGNIPILEPDDIGRSGLVDFCDFPVYTIKIYTTDEKIEMILICEECGHK